MCVLVWARACTPPAVTSISCLCRTKPSGHQSVPAAFIFLVFAHPVSTYPICLRQRGKVPGKNTHFLHHHSQQECACVCKKERRQRHGRLGDTLSSFSKWPAHNMPINQLSSQSGDLNNPQHKHGKRPAKCASVCIRSVWQFQHHFHSRQALS